MSRKAYWSKTWLVLMGLSIAGAMVSSSCERKPGMGINLPFRKVRAFVRQALLITSDQDLEYMDVSSDSGLVTGPPLYTRGYLPGTYTAFAVRPDGSKFYVGTDTDLLEFDSTAKLLRRIPITDFDLPGATSTRGDKTFYARTCFAGDAAATNEKIWIMAIPAIGLDDKDRVHGTAHLMEWDPSEPSEERVIYPLVLLSVQEAVPMAFDTSNRRAFFPSLGFVIDCTTGKREPLPWGVYTFADFDERWGLLLSDTLDVSTKRIARVDPDTGSLTEIADGRCAVWGSDGHIYFTRGLTQLWRCRPDGSRVEPVYAVTTDVRTRPEEPYGRPMVPRVSTERNFLAVSCAVSRPGVSHHSNVVLLFDLKLKQYRIVEGRAYDHFAWVVRPSI